MATMLEMIGQAAIPRDKNKEEKLRHIIARVFRVAKNSVLSLRKAFSSSADGVFLRWRDRLITHCV
jgi:hypothetical protein